MEFDMKNNFSMSFLNVDLYWETKTEQYNELQYDSSIHHGDTGIETVLYSNIWHKYSKERTYSKMQVLML